MSCFSIESVTCYEVAKDFASPTLAAIAAIISVYIAFKQISKQHRNNLDAQKEQAKRETKIQIFKEISEILDLEGAAIRDVHSYCFSKKYSNMEMKAPLEHAEFHELCNRFGRAILVVVGKVESHEIINFKLFRAFRFGLQSIHHDLLKLRTEADRFKVLEEVVELANNTLMYFYDFQICMQNISYGDVFDSEVPSREPADPSCKVIINCPNHLDELIVYFSQETNWGMDCAKYEKEALEAYS